MNPKIPFKPLLLVSVMLLLASAACGGGGEVNEAPTEVAAESPVEEQQAVEEESSPASGAATNVEEVQNAVIQIEFLGSYRDPAVGTVSGSGYGSGFIIDPSGIAVTNNHVVAGAASLKVRIGGDTTKTYNAKILGVSECSDLAVIDIEGEGFSYLEWYQEPINVGMEVYAVGFPLGEPEYTLTRGVVSKESTSGETAWASVDGVIGHDATINPGNSGGPLVNTDGQVVGVNYRSRPDYAQYFAISAENATPIIEQLRAGTDVDSIGVNGQAVASDDGSLTGVWVSSVVSGSPADKMGLEPGDVIVNMEGIPLATDGTMADYCDVLRSHNADDVLSIEVLRFDTKEGLKGQLNGEPLSVAFSFGQAAQEASGSKDTSGSLVKFEDSLSAGGAEGADKFSFIGTAGGEVIAYVAPASADLDVGIVVLDSADNVVVSVNDAGAGEAERLTLSIPGNAKLDVYSIYVVGETGGDYKGIFIGSQEIYFELMPQYLIAGSPPAGSSVGYAYAGKANRTLRVLAKPDSSNPMDVVIRIYTIADLSSYLAEANASGMGKPEELTFTIPADGIYIVEVKDAQGGSGSFLMATSTK